MQSDSRTFEELRNLFAKNNLIMEEHSAVLKENNRILQMTIYSIAASADAVLVAGVANDTIVLASSGDAATFNTTEIGNGTSPHVAASDGDIYVVWVQEDGILLAKSSDGGQTFGDAENISSNGGFWPKVAADEDTYVAWTENSDIMVAAQ